MTVLKLKHTIPAGASTECWITAADSAARHARKTGRAVGVYHTGPLANGRWFWVPWLPTNAEEIRRGKLAAKIRPAILGQRGGRPRLEWTDYGRKVRDAENLAAVEDYAVADEETRNIAAAIAQHAKEKGIPVIYAAQEVIFRFSLDDPDHMATYRMAVGLLTA